MKRELNVRKKGIELYHLPFLEDRPGNKHKKQINIQGMAHKIKGIPTIPHIYEGYVHDENGTRNLTTKEKKMVDRIINMWNNRASK